MQYQVFTVPVMESQPALEDLNRFMRGHRVLSVERRLIEDGRQSLWTFCVEYLDGAVPPFKPEVKVDYKDVLPPEQFAVFSRLRALRKEIAEREAVPPYAVFTNEQLAGLVRPRRSTMAQCDFGMSAQAKSELCSEAN